MPMRVVASTPEDPLSKIRRVEEDYLKNEVFECVSYEWDESAEVKGKGGMMTAGDTTYYDPLYVLGADDRVLAFTLAHEREHWKEDPKKEGGKAERDADIFALNLLHQSHWTKAEAEKAVVDWGAYTLLYFEGTKQKEPDSLTEHVGANLELCGKIWDVQA